MQPGFWNDVDGKRLIWYIEAKETVLYKEERMIYELDGMMGFDRLGLGYEVHMAGIDGECFFYSVYFQDGMSGQNIQDVRDAIDGFVEPYNARDIFPGYIDVTDAGEKASVYLDVGGADPDAANEAIYGILKALNNVPGVRLVMINED